MSVFGRSAAMPRKAMTPRAATAQKVAPAEDLADIGAERNTGDDGDRKAHEHHGNGRGATVFRHEIGRDGGADREKDAMGEGSNDARDQQHLIIG